MRAIQKLGLWHFFATLLKCKIQTRDWKLISSHFILINVKSVSADTFCWYTRTYCNNKEILIPLIELILFHSELLLALTTHEMYFHCLNLQWNNKTAVISHAWNSTLFRRLMFDRSRKSYDFFSLQWHRMFIFLEWTLKHQSLKLYGLNKWQFHVPVYILQIIHSHYSP